MSTGEGFYYHSLAEAGALFKQGLPILTYHKLGPRPLRVRLKGLYVSKALFAKQLMELLQAGYGNGCLSEFSSTQGQGFADRSPSSGPRREIILTFDDGFESVFKLGLRALAQHGFRAIQFLPAELLGKTNVWDAVAGERQERIMDASQVQAWLGAGHQIGSHSSTHAWLTRIGLDEAREEISSSKKKLEDQFGVPVEHFCYPYGDWNPAVRDLVVAAGYRTACTTDCGVNGPGTDPFSLKRITVRYPSRNWANFRQWLARSFPDKLKAQWLSIRPGGAP